MPIERHPLIPFEPRPTWRYKVTRANEHLASFRAQLEWFRHTGAYIPCTEFDPQTGRHRIIVESVLPISLQLPMLVGDFAHNLRSALDHLWCAILTAQGQPVTRRSQFPIFETEPVDRSGRDAWRKQVGTGLADELITEVKAVQPYTTRGQVPIEQHPLYVLNELDRRDKHFAVNLVAVQSLQSAVQVGDRLITLGQPKKLVPGAVVGEFGPEEIGYSGRIGEELEVKLGGAVEIVFEESWGTPGMSVNAILTNMIGNVVQWIGVLERFCPPRPAARPRG